MDPTERAFLAAIAAAPDEDLNYLVYADWLDEHDRPEEAARQRKLPAARRWMLYTFLRAVNHPDDWQDERKVYHEGSIGGPHTLEDCLRAGREALAAYRRSPQVTIRGLAFDFYWGTDAGADWFRDNDGADWAARLREAGGASAERRAAFFANWCVLAGEPPPDGLAERVRFSCSC